MIMQMYYLDGIQANPREGAKVIVLNYDVSVKCDMDTDVELDVTF